MRILNLGASFLQNAFRAQGHSLCRVGLDAGADVCVEHPVRADSLLARLREQGFTPDVAIWVDDGNLPFVTDMERLPCPSVFYSVDTFCNPWHFPFAAAFDMVFAAQKDFVPLFRREGHDAAWMPLFFSGIPPLEDAGAFARRDVPVAFVGTLAPRNIPDRLPFLKRFRQRHPLVFMQGDYVPLFTRARIVLNQTAAQELNFRCFEAMACGAALLMETCGHGLGDLFEPGLNVLPTYPPGDAASAADIAAQWLARPAELAAVAQAGQELVLARHRAVHRTEQVCAIFESLLAAHSQARRLADPLRQRIVSTAYGIIAAELSDPDLSQLRHFFAALCDENLPLRPPLQA